MSGRNSATGWGNSRFHHLRFCACGHYAQQSAGGLKGPRGRAERAPAQFVPGAGFKLAAGGAGGGAGGQGPGSSAIRCPACCAADHLVRQDQDSSTSTNSTAPDADNHLIRSACAIYGRIALVELELRRLQNPRRHRPFLCFEEAELGPRVPGARTGRAIGAYCPPLEPCQKPWPGRAR